MANDSSLQAKDIHVIPPVNGQDNVQDALEAGGGGGGGFPVGPQSDATATYEIMAEGGSLTVSDADNSTQVVASIALQADPGGANAGTTAVGADGIAVSQLSLDATGDGSTSSDMQLSIDDSQWRFTPQSYGSADLVFEPNTNDPQSFQIRTTDSFSVVTEAGEQLSLAVDALQLGPVTDADGNVYSIEYDPTAKTLQLQCVTPDPHKSSVAVAPNGFDLSVDDGTSLCEIVTGSGTLDAHSTLDANNNLQSSLSLHTDDSGAGNASAGIGVGGDVGVASFSLAVDNTPNPSSLVVTLDNGTPLSLTSTSVVFDAGSIPEGDPHVDRALFTVGYVQGVTAGTVMMSAG